MKKEYCLAKYADNKYIKAINDFMTTPFYVFIAAALAIVSNLFGAELYIYSIYVFCGIYISLFGRDFLPLMPLVINCYIAPSLHNNPGRNADSIFYPQNYGIYLGCIVALWATSVIFRICKDDSIGGKNFLKAERRLASGMYILGIAYILAGAFSGRYFEKGINNLIFATVQFAAIFAFYWFFCGAVDWKKARKDFFAWVGLAVGIIICFEVAGVYISQSVIQKGAIHTALIASGWGNANNLGCMVAMMIPFAFWLSGNKKHGLFFSILGVLMVGFTALTCSRTAIGAAVMIYGICFCLAMFDSKRRKNALIVTGIAIVFVLCLLFIFRSFTERLFGDLFDRGLDPRMRDIVYKEGIEVFKQKPIFGDTFYPEKISVWPWSTLEGFDSIVPNRWHNTIIQLLASCGIVGLIAYSIHRIQTIRLFWEKRKTAAVYIGLSLVALMLMSLLDCHFFNIGPTLFYSMGLAFAEKCNID